MIDNTLPVNPTLPNPVPDTNPGNTGGTIQPINQDNGVAAGNNLFYSFSQFNIGSGDTAYFNLIQNWENVIARVTGGDPSLILGTLRVGGSRLVDGDTSHHPDFVDGIAGATNITGAKNFFFINPAGIVFGPGSVVDVPGSFYASTASELKFKDGSIYGMDESHNPISQLTASAPDAFGFLGNETGALVLDHATIQVFNDETLALVGRDITIDSSTVGQVDLMKPTEGYNSSGIIDPNATPRFVTKGDLFIDGIQLLLMAHHGKQDVKILAHDPDQAEANAAYNMAAISNLKLDGNIDIRNTDLINAGGDAEEITLIRGGNINLTNASIVSSNYGDDCAGICGSDASREPVPGISGIDILATGKLTLNNGHIVTETSFAPVNPAADNVAIKIQAASMLMDNHSSVSTKSLNVAHVNPDYVPAGIYPIPHPMAPRAGNIDIKIVNDKGVYGDFTARGGSSVESSTETFGDAGKINIEAGSITLNNASVKSESTSTHNGLTGYVEAYNGNIQRALDPDGYTYYGRTTTYRLLSEDHSRYTSPFNTPSALRPDLTPPGILLLEIDHAKNAGAAGTVSLTAHNGDIALVNNSTVSTDIQSGTSNTESAKISLNAGAGSILMDGSKVTSTTSGDAKAGDIQLTAANSITLNNASEVTTDTKGINDGGSGEGGAISTHSKTLAINAGSFISSSTDGLGRAGTVNVEAETVMINGLWPIPVNHLGRYFDESFTGIRTIASARSGGQTGNIDIHASGDVYMTDGAQISISNLATVDQARLSSLYKTHINLNASSIYLTNSQIVADSSGNVDAGDINIIFKEWLKLDPSAISTIAFDGNGGNINIGGGNYIWLQDSMIATSVLGLRGNGGNIDIQSNFLIMDSGFIQANTAAEGASGGLVNINVGTLIPSGGTLFVGGDTPYQFQPFSGINVIQAAAPGGVSGQVNTTPPQLNLSGTLANLIVQSFDPNAISRNLCAIGESSSLSQSGKGGLRRQAKDPLLTTYSPLLSY
ncbi:MAG: filamentous hemagglutinin N-terminal domain-containing protein [Methylococcaceae bacterium]|nr:filamentous hemagglutinin N-terminal domain-containing protein [Methylococcaceae bacterium]